MIKELEQNVCQLKQQLQESELQRKQQLKVSPMLLNRAMAKSHPSFPGVYMNKWVSVKKLRNAGNRFWFFYCAVSFLILFILTKVDANVIE